MLVGSRDCLEIGVLVRNRPYRVTVEHPEFVLNEFVQIRHSALDTSNNP